MKKRKFGQAALDAIDIEIDALSKGPIQIENEKQAIAELRDIRRVIVAAGKSVFIRGTGRPLVMDIDSRVRIEKAILKSREVEGKRK